MERKDPLDFIEKRIHYLSPFSAHRIEIWGETFPTIEHAYHYARFTPCTERDSIKNAPSPMDAWRLSQELKEQPALKNKNFDKDAIMEELSRAKMAQHADIVDVLKKTVGHGLLKVFPTDYYWGTGADGSGQNMLGKIWMKLREDL